MKKIITVVIVFSVITVVTILSVEAASSTKPIVGNLVTENTLSTMHSVNEIMEVKEPVTEVLGESIHEAVTEVEPIITGREDTASDTSASVKNYVPDNTVQCPYGNVQCMGNHDQGNCLNNNDENKTNHNENHNNQQNTNGDHHGGHNR